jgi:hypothetical protein
MSDSRNEEDEVDEVERDDLILIKRAAAAIAVAVVGELALGRRALIAYEAVRRAAKWAADEKRKKGQVPSAQAAMEEALGDFLVRSRRAIAQTKPKLEEMRSRTRESLSDPSIGAIVSGGAAVAVVATIGLVPAAIGATTACLFHYYANAEDDETDAEALTVLPAPNSRA